MTDKTNNNAAAQNTEQEVVPVDINAYVLALVEALKDDELATQDLSVVVAILNTYVAFLAQLGFGLVFVHLENGQLAAKPYKLPQS